MDNEKLRILVIGAHPDDCEFTTGGIAAKFGAMGHIVKYLSVTNGDAGHQSMRGRALADRRNEEAKNSAGIAGLESLILDNHDGYLTASIPVRERIICEIRKFKPDMIFTHRTNDYHPDHRNTGILVQDSSYLIMVPNVCPEVPPLRYTPAILYMCDNFKKSNEFTADIVVDIDDVVETKAKMLSCHRSQVYEWLPWVDGLLDTVPSDENEKFEWLKNGIINRAEHVANRFRDNLNKRYGTERGSKVRCAEAFEISEYGAQLSKEDIEKYFPF